MTRHVRDRLVVGLISGTSVDAIDAALVRIGDAGERGERRRIELLASSETPFAPELRRAIFAHFPPRRGSVASLAALDVALGEAFAAATLDLLTRAGTDPRAVDLIGSHGQTVYHAPRPPGRGWRASPVTVQVGSGAVIAARTGITTVYDFRLADLAAGGEGAPLAPYLDYLHFGDGRSLAVQNIGGIGNATIIARGKGAEGVFAFDTGPGNMLIDAVTAAVTGGRQGYDADGAIAARGAPSARLLDETMEHPYFARRPPKSTGREEFGTDFALGFQRRGAELGLAGDDLVATATALTARSIADAYRRFVLPQVGLEAIILSGGGARNPTLRRMLADELAPLPVETFDQYGLPSEAKEAVLFAVLAYETAHGRPSNLPAATGASRPAILGSIAPGRGFRLWPAG